MRSQSYTPRHGAPRPAGRGAAALAAVRRPVVGGAIAAAMLGSVGATVAIGDPTHGEATAAMDAPSATSETATTDSTHADTTRLAQDRRASNVSRSASREKDRLETIKRQKAAAAERTARAERKAAAKKKAQAKQRAAEQAKPLSQRRFTDAEIRLIQADPAPYGKQLLGEYGWGEGEWSCLVNLWIGESDWRWDATNSSSGAYGIPQALPATKMASAGSDWKTNPITQMVWGLDYIKTSYGSPCQAKAFWDSKDPHWY